jgi:DNA-directed RNA polymerase specialized sigma24 family protein
VIEPLRKIRSTGGPYARRAEVGARLEALDVAPSEDVARWCGISDRADPDHVPSECLVHLVRRTRGDNGETWFRRLHDELIRRVLRRLPSVRPDGTEALVTEEIRDYVLDRFQDLLVADRASYSERLDIYEVSFDAALARLRIDGQRAAWRRERRRAPLEDDETGVVRAEVEAAAGTVDPLADAGREDPAYRKRLDAAIDSLPPEQREIIHMLMLGYPIEAKDPEATSIAKTLGCVERTVRSRRDRAFATIRAIMSEDDAP